jgi:hypothetical protein
MRLRTIHPIAARFLHRAMNNRRWAMSLHAQPDGGVVSEEGWSVSVLDAEWIEYRHGSVACVMNAPYSVERQASEIWTSDDASALPPRLHEHLTQALPLLRGRFVVR